jgi:hypothetical protein
MLAEDAKAGFDDFLWAILWTAPPSWGVRFFSGWRSVVGKLMAAT